MKRHGCYDRQPLRDWHHAQDGYWPMSKPDAASRLPRIVQIPHVMTRECQYTLHNPTDAGCTGCKHQSKE